MALIVVIIVRLVVPLLILRRPLLGGILAIVVDAADFSFSVILVGAGSVGQVLSIKSLIKCWIPIT